MKNVEKIICSAFTIEICNKLVEHVSDFCVFSDSHMSTHSIQRNVTTHNGYLKWEPNISLKIELICDKESKSISANPM